MNRSVFVWKEEKLNACVHLDIRTFEYMFKTGMNNLFTYHSR